MSENFTASKDATNTTAATNETQKNFASKKTPSDATPAPRFEHWELHVAKRVGLTKDEIREVRRRSLTEGVHWVTHKKRTVYSALGVQTLEQALEVNGESDVAGTRLSDTGEAESTVKKPETKILKVFRNGLKHSQIIEAHFPDKDPADVRNRVRVRVRSDKNFIKGMEIPVWELQPGLYELARACPRARGRW